MSGGTDMGFPTYWLAAALGLSAVACAIIARLVLRLSSFPGRTYYIVTQAGLFWWIACDTIEHLQSSGESALFWAEFANLGIIVGPACWGLFVWNYIYGRYRPSPRSLDWLLGLFSVTIWLLALTNGYHHLLYDQIIAVTAGPHPFFQYTHGPAYVAYHIVLFLVALISYCIILYSILNADRLYRLHYIGFALSTALPWVTNGLYFTGMLPKVPFDTTPLTFFITTVIFYWLIRKRQMFDLLPIAHGMLLDIIPDPILVVDNRDRIEECNSAARELAGGRALIGQSLTELMGPSSEAGIGHPPRHFDVGDVPLFYAGSQVGRLILLRDITRLRETMAELEKQLHANLELQRQLKEETIRDPLTGLHNRRFLAELAPVLIAEADRSGQTLALAILDIDHFKKLNDGYGHQAGDAVLRALGGLLRQSIRQSDTVVRLGGEEFLLLMPHSGAERALARIEEWRSDFSAASTEHEGQRLSATFSAGLAVYPDDAADLDELMRRADIALYRAKGEGRNRSVSWRPDMA